MPKQSSRPRRRGIQGLTAAAALLIMAAAITGCGSSSGSRTANKGEAVPGVPQPTAAAFQPARGRSIKQIAAGLTQGPHAALANSVFVPGHAQRLAFGLLDDNQKFVYAQAAVYIAPTVSSPARGPFLAPLDSIVPSPAFRSQTTANDPAAIKAVYHASVPLRRTGPVAALIVTRLGGHDYGSVAGFKVAASTPIPSIGQQPPRIDTPTVASAGGDLRSIDTRVPPDDMHKVSFKDVVGKRPVALLFATPQLCQSRVCGPVVDIEQQMEGQYGGRMTFIHQEVYANNTVANVLRPQLTAFHLQTEPWLFTFDRSGRIVARLEGSFGVNEFQHAIEAALRGV